MNLKKLIFLNLIIFLFIFANFSSYADTILNESHIEYINNLFKNNGISNGYVELDQYGRLKLKGSYEDEAEVDKAFSIAQSVVGIKWVSPVTPENIKVKEWEKQLSKIIQRAKIIDTISKKDGSPPGPIRNRYAVVAGIGQFKYGIETLHYAVRDAMNFYNFLTDLRRGGFKKEEVLFLTDQNATRANIMNALNKIKSLAQEDDLVVLYISSHGTPPDKFGGVHIVTYDTEVKPREKVWHTSLHEGVLKEFLDQLRAKRVVFILDTCYSNGAYSGITGFLPPGGKSLGVEKEEAYGVSKDYAKRLIGAKDIVIDDTPKPKIAKEKSSNFGDDAWGTVMMSASGPNEKSWESDQLKQSIFTYYFLEGLNQSKGSVKEAFFYAKPRVKDRVKREKGSDIDQTPQVYVTNERWDIKIIK
ncbi:MAG: caspase domain-containing protein [Thermodesulfovibrionales bacterium]